MDDLRNALRLVHREKKDEDRQSNDDSFSSQMENQRRSNPSTLTNSSSSDNLNVVRSRRFDMLYSTTSESSNTLSDLFNSTESEKQPWVPIGFSENHDTATTSKPQRRPENCQKIIFNSLNDCK